MLSVPKSGNCEFFIFFYGEELLPLRPTPKLEDHPLSVVRDCLFDIFAASVHIESRCIIRSLRTRHDMVTRTMTSHCHQWRSYVFIGARGEKAKWSPVAEIVSFFKKIAFAEFPYIWLKK